ncbi:unnamed protein product [Pylaiella littoralis]
MVVICITLSKFLVHNYGSLCRVRGMVELLAAGRAGIVRSWPVSHRYHTRNVIEEPQVLVDLIYFDLYFGEGKEIGDIWRPPRPISVMYRKGPRARPALHMMRSAPPVSFSATKNQYTVDGASGGKFGTKYISTNN